MCVSEASGGFRADQVLPDLLARASHILAGGFNAVLRRHGVSIPIWRTMAVLTTEPGQTVSALAATCLLQQPTMTKLLDRMERDGLAARAHDAQDRRVVRVTLTPEGRAKAAELAAVAERHEARIMALHPDAEMVKAVLRAIIARSGPARPAQGDDEAAS